MSDVDWARYRQCPACIAELGQPCMELSGLSEKNGPVQIEADRPHGGRPLRSEARRG